MHNLSAVKRILIIKLRHHGDILLTTPVARTLKSRYPDCEIDLLVYKGTEPLLQHNPDIHQIWCLNRQTKGWRKLYAQIKLFITLYRRHYTLILHLSDQMQGAFWAKCLHPQQAIGFDYPKRRHTPWQKCFTVLAPWEHNVHTVTQNLLALQPLGITPTEEEQRCVLNPSIQARKRVQGLLETLQVDTPYIVVHPGSRWFFKCWEDDRFAAVIQTLANEDWKVIITAAPEAEEMALVTSILQQTLSPNITSLAGQLNLSELTALIEGARLFIGVDSAPMHMAAALGKDVLTLFGPSKIALWHPWMTRYRLIYAGDYGRLIDPDQIDTNTTERLLKAIPMEPVLHAAQELLSYPAIAPGTLTSPPSHDNS